MKEREMKGNGKGRGEEVSKGRAKRKEARVSASERATEKGVSEGEREKERMKQARRMIFKGEGVRRAGESSLYFSRNGRRRGRSAERNRVEGYPELLEPQL